MILINFLKKIFVVILLISLTSCGSGFLKPDWSKKAEPSGKKRAQKNVQEGRGIKFFKPKGKGGDFLFASSNPLWRASLDVIDFMGLSNVDYAGGLIITDWFSDNNPNESIKVTIKFLSNEIRVDALEIDVRKKNCNQTNNCIIKKIKSDLDFQIKDKILKKAALYKIDLDKEIKKNTKDKVFKPD